MNPLIVTKSRYVLGHGRLCASGVLTRHSEGMWAIFMIKVKLMASIPKCWKCWTVLQNASLPMEGSLPRVVCDPGSVMKLQASAKSFSVFILLEWSFPCCALSSWIWVGENVPLKTVALAARVRHHAGQEEGRGLPAELSPGEQLFSVLLPST